MTPLLRLLVLCCMLWSIGHAGDAIPVPTTHPRIFLTKAELPALAARCAGPAAKDYAALKEAADNAVRAGAIRWIANKWATPQDLLSCAMTYLIERQAGRPCKPYADLIITTWGDGRMIANQGGSSFGYHAIAYDWIHDALDPTQRRIYGDALGGWLTWFSGEAAITLKSGYWEYNQTWGPSHLNVMHSRDAITQKLLIALAIHGAGSAHQHEAERFLASWASRIPAECIPAFDAMGGSWAESHGHGAYGPITVIPYAFEAWRTATGQNLFSAGKPWGFLPEMSRWLTCLRVPHVDRHAFIDDGGGDRFAGFAASAPLVARALRDPLAQWQAQQAYDDGRYDDGPWARLLIDPTLRPRSPAELKLPLGYLLAGAGHVFMRSAWNDPNATWAFFGAGPHLAGHQHDDEGHFLIARRGGLVGKGGGKGGGNDADNYWGGSLAFNIITIFDPAEKPRRAAKNENDGGLLRHVYEDRRIERGHMTAFRDHAAYTYAAADLTAGYAPEKARAVSRQFLYLRGRPGIDEFFIVLDRVVSTKASFAKHFMLHVPAEPAISGAAEIVVPGHVSRHGGDGIIASWLSRPDDFGPDTKILSNGRSRMFLRSMLPKPAQITKRGGAGHRNWGHPLEPSAQYDHAGPGRDEAPLCDWRLEFAAPLEAETIFLHVFQVADEAVQEMAPVKLNQGGGTLQLEIGAAPRLWKVALAARGEPGGSVSGPGLPNASRLPTTLETQEQYRLWQDAVKPTKPR
ncbi:MAG: hypothetical protein J0M02_09680 [Planctomycetes bacterium]|nr:hypothetical protein [Planctomycetota bacterium]